MCEIYCEKGIPFPLSAGGQSSFPNFEEANQKERESGRS